MGTPGKTSNGLKQELEQLHQNCLCLTQHKCSISATARQALHDWRRKLLHYPSFLAPAAPAHTTKSFPSSCDQNSTIHTSTSVDLLPSAQFSSLSSFPPFLLSPMEFTPTTATPQSPGRFSQLRLSLVYLESLQHLFPAKIICIFAPFENFISLRVLFRFVYLPGFALNFEVKGLYFY